MFPEIIQITYKSANSQNGNMKKQLPVFYFLVKVPKG